MTTVDGQNTRGAIDDRPPGVPDGSFCGRSFGCLAVCSAATRYYLCLDRDS
ncbi:hypothetical protein V1J52_13375 [Streptomyces sp. TRM 70351]|uniref:hypothetical protein n=1 Tax=Streptomyces sp. TRM 70351 TaxID=3116552 RepID=UPI002E7ABB8F|nr:hypothetical protein [Streptomyces sp. TRM 70351]MEE1929155.1 hypothetical protein [Streptomyces sp. TRM 70351]